MPPSRSCTLGFHAWSVLALFLLTKCLTVEGDAGQAHRQLLTLGDGQAHDLEVASFAPITQLSLDNSNITAPSNVSGTYKGSWSMQSGAALDIIPVLQQGTGTVGFQLKATPSNHEEVLDVQGDLVLRDGEYISEHDTFMKMEGVYIIATGRLQAVVTPVNKVQVSLEQQDVDLHTADYRKALRRAASSFEEDIQPFVQPKHNLSDPSSLHKDCDFTLDLKAVIASKAGSGTASQGLPSHPPGLPSDSQGLSPDSESEISELELAGSRWLGRFWRQSSHEKHVQPQDLILNGTLLSRNCGVQLQINATTTHIEVYEAKAVNYTFMVTALTFVQVLLLLRQMECTTTQATASKVSLLMLGQQAVIDAYLCLLHLTTGFVVEPLFNAFATASFFEFVNFAIFEMQYLLSIWRARRGSALDTWHTQRELAILYVRFYGALLGSIFLTYQSPRIMPTVLMLVYSFWIPQIVHCARTDAKQPLRPLYVVGMSVTRLLLPMYFYGCPSNVMRQPPNPVFCFILVGWLSLQALVLLLQTAWGPRWFVPKRFLPAKYDYHRPVVPREVAEGVLDSSSAPPSDVETGYGGCECVICMNPADVGQPGARMVTPCNHFFHNQCLERWMDVKMECPTCRRPLPPP